MSKFTEAVALLRAAKWCPDCGHNFHPGSECPNRTSIGGFPCHCATTNWRGRRP